MPVTGLGEDLAGGFNDPAARIRHIRGINEGLFPMGKHLF
jgi:hypothetical protein